MTNGDADNEVVVLWVLIYLSVWVIVHFVAKFW